MLRAAAEGLTQMAGSSAASPAFGIGYVSTLATISEAIGCARHGSAIGSDVPQPLNSRFAHERRS